LGAPRKNEGRFPNVTVMIQHHKSGHHFPPDFDVAAYISANTELIGKFSHDWEYINHYLDSGVSNKLRYRRTTIDFSFIEALYGVSFKPSSDSYGGVGRTEEQNQEAADFADRRLVELYAEIRQLTGESKVYTDVNSLLVAHGI
jgi:hypothetical protein